MYDIRRALEILDCVSFCFEVVLDLVSVLAGNTFSASAGVAAPFVQDRGS